LIVSSDSIWGSIKFGFEWLLALSDEVERSWEDFFFLLFNSFFFISLNNFLLFERKRKEKNRKEEEENYVARYIKFSINKSTLSILITKQHAFDKGRFLNIWSSIAKESKGNKNKTSVINIARIFCLAYKIMLVTVGYWIYKK